MPSPNQTPTLHDLSNVPIADLVEAATERFKRATLDELTAILGGGPAPVGASSPDAIAAAVLAMTSPGSKLDAIQNAVVMRAHQAAAGNVAAAARLLGMERKAYARKLARARRKRSTSG